MKICQFYPVDLSIQIPRTFKQDLELLFSSIPTPGDWRATSPTETSVKHQAKFQGFETEKSLEAINQKRVDLYKHYETSEMSYSCVIEIETSTIENTYNDLLKIMELLKSGEIDYGVVIIVQNERSGQPRLTLAQMESNLVKGLRRVLDDFRGKLFMYHVTYPG